jgi:hypothetical protein
MLLRTILMCVILVILAHMGLVYSEVEEERNNLTQGIYELGNLLEIPAQVAIDALSIDEQGQGNQERGFYFVGFAAVIGYFVLFLLLGVGRR